MELLKSLYDTIPGSTAGERWAELAARLNRLVDRKWNGTTIQGAANGSVKITATMERAANMLAASIDGAPPHLVSAIQSSTWSAPDNPLDHAYIMGRAVACEKCGAKFVGSVPWRRFCPSCHPPRHQD